MRSRNIKPGFFKNELLAELPPTTRLFFIGLWCYADRDGRFEDRPAKIKMDVLPCDSFDAEAAMSDLCRRGFVLRYDVDGLAMAVVLNWGKHQNPHHTEKASVLPPYVHGCVTVTSRLSHGDVTVSPPSYNGEYPAGFTDSLIQPPPPPTGEPSVSSLFPGEESLSPSKKGGAPAVPYRWDEFAALYPENGTIFDTAGKNWWKQNVKRGDDALVDLILAGVRRWNSCRQYQEGLVFNCGKWLKNRAFEKPTPDEVDAGKARQGENDIFAGAL